MDHRKTRLALAAWSNEAVAWHGVFEWYRPLRRGPSISELRAQGWGGVRKACTVAACTVSVLTTSKHDWRAGWPLGLRELYFLPHRFVGHIKWWIVKCQQLWQTAQLCWEECSLPLIPNSFYPFIILPWTCNHIRNQRVTLTRRYYQVQGDQGLQVAVLLSSFSLSMTIAR
jgi:hypothetical protein